MFSEAFKKMETFLKAAFTESTAPALWFVFQDDIAALN